MANCYFLPITLRMRLDRFADQHSVECLGLAMWLNYQFGYVCYELVQEANPTNLASNWPHKQYIAKDCNKLNLANGDAIVISNQVALQEQIDKYGSVQPAALQSISLLKQVAIEQKAKIYFWVQDPRPRFTLYLYELLRLVPELANYAKLAMTTSAKPELFSDLPFSFANIAYCLPYVAKQTIGPWVSLKEAMAKQYSYDFAFAGFQFEPERIALFEQFELTKRYNSVGIGPTEPFLPSITNSQLVNGQAVAELSKLAKHSLYAQSPQHKQSGGWASPRLWQAILYGQLLWVPSKYSAGLGFTDEMHSMCTVYGPSYLANCIKQMDDEGNRRAKLMAQYKWLADLMQVPVWALAGVDN